jgi:hypothetical protein
MFLEKIKEYYEDNEDDPIANHIEHEFNQILKTFYYTGIFN